MFRGYQNDRGRALLKEMASYKEEAVFPCYQMIRDKYPDLLEKEWLTQEEKNQYNALVDANVFDLSVKRAVTER